MGSPSARHRQSKHAAKTANILVGVYVGESDGEWDRSRVQHWLHARIPGIGDTLSAPPKIFDLGERGERETQEERDREREMERETERQRDRERHKPNSVDVNSQLC